MEPLSEEQRKIIMNSSPVGTWALMLTVAIGLVLGWLFFYYGVFLPRGFVE
jgi:hypothetical protein